MANEATKFTINGVQHDVMDVGARQLIASVQAALNAITSGDTTTAIKTFQEVIDFLDGVTDDATLVGKLNELRTLINGKYAKPANGIPLSDLVQSVQNILSDVANKANSTEVVKSISVNGTAQTKDTNGNVNIEVPSGGLTESDISVETQGDGTVDINVGSDTYTINLNHTHENMAKLVVCEESGLPSTLDPATIYAITDNGETEIEKLIIRGMEFAGGGGTPGLPAMQSPSDGSTIQLGENQGSGVSQNIVVRAKNLNYGGSTDGLTIEAIGTGLTLSYGQQTGQSSITIPQNNGAVNTEMGVAYSGSGSFNGELRFKQGSTVLAVVVVVVLPDGFIANKAWNQVGDSITLDDADGYCVSRQFEVNDNHTFEVCFGFVNSVKSYGCAVSHLNTMLSSGIAETSFWANARVRTFKPNIGEKYLSCTFLIAELNDCYIKDTDTNTYFWKGNNVT